MITVEWLEGRTPQQKEQLTKAITDAVVHVTHVSKDHVWIVFRDVARADWAMGGQLLSKER
jgi:4-oxalocrotonate tautomerase